ncbi:MAG: hypothetical protein WCO78_02785 [Candidatus Roizmanbacteria bacterium]
MSETPDPTEKIAQVDALYQGYWDAFTKWQGTSGTSLPTLAVPAGISDVFIPKRILELAEDSRQVHALVSGQKSLVDRYTGCIELMVVETVDRNLTDPKRFADWWEKRQTGTVVVGSDSFYEMPTHVPEGIEYKHYQHASLVAAGLIGLNQKVYLDYTADVIREYPNTVKTRNFFDRPDLHGKGIGTSFYNRLEQTLSHLGFKYLMGEVISPHKSFYEKSRTPYHLLTDQQKKELPLYHMGDPEYLVKELRKE